MSLNMDKSFVGAVGLIIGTSLGAGMLALPVVNSYNGLLASSVYLIVAWALMMFCALVMAEVNLSFSPNTNMFNMAKYTLGRTGHIFTVLIYLILLNSLLSAYISGCSEVLHSLFMWFGWSIAYHWLILLFVGIFGMLVILSINVLEKTNIVFLILKFMLFLGIIMVLMPFTSNANYMYNDWSFQLPVWFVLCASFGFGVVIPSIRVFLDSDPKKIRKAIIVGSVIPLILYLVWTSVVIGVLSPTEILQPLNSSIAPNVTLSYSLTEVVNINYLFKIFGLFVGLCLLTSFFGVGLSLSDCLSDGLKLFKHKNKALIYILTFAPSACIVLWRPQIFIQALEYAGLSCILLHVVLPCFMLYALRKNNENNRSFLLKTKSYIVLSVGILGLIMACAGVYSWLL